MAWQIPKEARANHLTKLSILGNAETTPGGAGWTSHFSINKRTISSFIFGCDRSPVHSRNPKGKSKAAAENFPLRGRRCADGSVGLSGGLVPASANSYSCNGVYGEPQETASLLLQHPYLKMDSSNLQCGHLVSPGAMNFGLSMYVFPG